MISPPPMSKPQCGHGQQDATDDGKRSVVAACRGENFLLCEITELLSLLGATLKGILSLAARSLPTAMRISPQRWELWPLGMTPRKQASSGANNGESPLSVISFRFFY